MLNLVLPVPRAFWSVYDAGDLHDAAEILGKALVSGSPQANAEGKDDSVLARYLPNYVTDQFIFDETSISVLDVKWDEDRLSGKVRTRFRESRMKACGFGRDIEDRKTEQLTFRIENGLATGNEREVRLYLLEAPVCFSPE